MAEQQYQDPKQKGTTPLKGVNRQQNNNNGGASQEAPTVVDVIKQIKADTSTRDMARAARTGVATIEATRRSMGLHDPIIDRDERDAALQQVNYGKSKYDDAGSAFIAPEAVQDYRAEQQSAFLKAVNGFTKGVGLFATTYLSGTIGNAWGFIRSAQAIAEGQQDRTATDHMNYVFSRMWDNEVTNFLEHVNRGMEDVLPNYYTRDQQEDPMTWRNIFSTNFLFDKVIKNLGFTVGAMYSAKTNLGVITLPFKYIGAINKAMKWANRANKMSRAAGKPGSVSFFDGLSKGAKATELALNQNKAFTNVRSFIGSAMNAFGEGAIEAVNNVNDWDKLQRQKLDDEYQEKVSELTTKYMEEGKLSMTAMGEVFGAGKEEYEAELAKLEEEKAQKNKEIDIERSKMGNSIVAGNVMLLTVPEMLMFGKFYGKYLGPAKQKSKWFYKATQEAKEALGRKGAKKLARKANRESLDALTDAEKALVQSKGKGLNKTWQTTKAIGKGLGAFTMEAQEEMNQGIIAEAAGQNATNMVDWKFSTGWDSDTLSETIGYFSNLMDSVLPAYEKKWKDPTWWEEGLIGGITGLMGVPTFGRINNSTSETYLGKGKMVGLTGGAFAKVGNVVREYKKNKADLNRFDDIVRNGFAPRLHHLAKQINYNKIGEQALLNDDEFSYQTSQTASTVEDMLFLDRGGALDPYLSRAQASMNMSDEEVADLIKKTRESVASSDKAAVKLAVEKKKYEKEIESIQKERQRYVSVVNDPKADPETKRAAQEEVARLDDQITEKEAEISKIDNHDTYEEFKKADMAKRAADNAYNENISKSQATVRKRDALLKRLEQAINDNNLEEQKALQDEIEKTNNEINELAEEQKALANTKEETDLRFQEFDPQEVSPFFKEDGTEMSIEEARKVIEKTNSDYMDLAAHVRSVRQEMSQISALTDEQIDTMTWYQVMSERIAFENAEDFITLFNDSFDRLQEAGFDEGTRAMYEMVLTQRILKDNKDISYELASEQARKMITDREKGNKQLLDTFANSLKNIIQNYKAAKTPQQKREFAADLFALLNKQVDMGNNKSDKFVNLFAEMAKMVVESNKTMSEDVKSKYNKSIETALKASKFFDEMQAKLEEFLKSPEKVEKGILKKVKEYVDDRKKKKDEKEVKKVIDKVDMRMPVGTIARQLLKLRKDGVIDKVRLSAVRDALQTDEEKKKFEEAVKIVDYVTSLNNTLATQRFPLRNLKTKTAIQIEQELRNTLDEIWMKIAESGNVKTAADFKANVEKVFDIERYKNEDPGTKAVFEMLEGYHPDFLMLDEDQRIAFMESVIDDIRKVLAITPKPLPKPNPDGKKEEENIPEVDDEEENIPDGSKLDEEEERRRKYEERADEEVDRRTKIEERIDTVVIQDEDGKDIEIDIEEEFPPTNIPDFKKKNKEEAERQNNQNRQETNNAMNDKDNRYINRPQLSERALSNIAKTVEQHYHANPAFENSAKNSEYIQFVKNLNDYLINNNAYNNSNALKIGDKLTFDVIRVGNHNVAIIKSGDKIVGSLASWWDVSTLNEQIRKATESGKSQEYIDGLIAKRDYYADIVAATADGSIKNRKAKVNRKMGGEINKNDNEVKSLKQLGYTKAKITQLLDKQFRHEDDITMMSNENRERMHGALFVLISDGKGKNVPFTLRAASLHDTFKGTSQAQKYYTTQVNQATHNIVETLKITDSKELPKAIKEANTALRRLVPVKGLFVVGVNNPNGGKFLVVKWKDANGNQMQQTINNSSTQTKDIFNLIKTIVKDNKTTVNYDFNRENDAEYQEHMLALLETNLNPAFESQGGEPRKVNNWFTFEYTEGNTVNPSPSPSSNKQTLTEEGKENITRGLLNIEAESGAANITLKQLEDLEKRLNAILDSIKNTDYSNQDAINNAAKAVYEAKSELQRTEQAEIKEALDSFKNKINSTNDLNTIEVAASGFLGRIDSFERRFGVKIKTTSGVSFRDEIERIVEERKKAIEEATKSEINENLDEFKTKIRDVVAGLKTAETVADFEAIASALKELVASLGDTSSLSSEFKSYLETIKGNIAKIEQGIKQKKEDEANIKTETKKADFSNPDGTFGLSGKPGDGGFSFVKTGENTAEFVPTTNNILYVDAANRSVTKHMDAPVSEAKGYIVIKPGKAEFKDGKWVVTEKAEVITTREDEIKNDFKETVERTNIVQDVDNMINSFKNDHTIEDMPMPVFEEKSFTKKESTLIERAEETTTKPQNAPNNKGKGRGFSRPTNKQNPASASKTVVDKEKTKQNIMAKFNETFKQGIYGVVRDLLAPKSWQDHRIRNSKNPDKMKRDIEKNKSDFQAWVLTNLTAEEYQLFKELINEQVSRISKELQDESMKIKANDIRTALQAEFGFSIPASRRSEYEARKKELQDTATQSLEDELFCAI
jgi:hypothetical protein